MEQVLRPLTSLILFLPGIIFWHRVFSNYTFSGLSALILGVAVSLADVLVVIFLSAVVNFPVVFTTIIIALALNDLVAILFVYFNRNKPKKL